MYNILGEPWKAQELLDNVLHTQYQDMPDGLSGNEDCGQMSAWYVMNAMGFYQPCPGRPEYSIGRPLFDAVTIRLPEGKMFHISVMNNSPQNKYIREVTLNGTPLTSPFFSHKDLMNGGTLEVTLTDKPTQWGTGL